MKKKKKKKKKKTKKKEQGGLFFLFLLFCFQQTGCAKFTAEQIPTSIGTAGTRSSMHNLTYSCSDLHLTDKK